MYSAPTSRSPDLQRLVDEGYSLRLVHGLLVVDRIPYVDSDRQVRHGEIVVPVTMSGERARAPSNHAVWWSGGQPSDASGHPLRNVVMGAGFYDLGAGIRCSHILCNKPIGREFKDYHELVTAYERLISPHAARLDPASTARPRRGAIRCEPEHHSHTYLDTGVARAGIGALSERLRQTVAIVGAGGTGAWILDLVSKTQATAIHLFDDDVFQQHNAYRMPGAASGDEVAAGMGKTSYLAGKYSFMHRRIVPHSVRIDRSNLDLLDRMDFVFIAIDGAVAKRSIIDHLHAAGKSFIDAGMGVEVTRDGLIGSVRTTTSTPRMREHISDKARIPLDRPSSDDAYRGNAQIADLNALNAALAVIRWKRLSGFYLDQSDEHHCVFSVERNHLISDDAPG